VDDTLVEVTAMRLVLAICVGGRPMNVRAGAMIIPPPTPITEPRVPAPRPMAMRIATVVAGSSKSAVFLYGASVITGRVKIVCHGYSFGTLILCLGKCSEGME
jgi:hypothetical protein